jgi:hypothetical protein
MKIYIKLKSAGKRKPALEDIPFVLPDLQELNDKCFTLRRLIEIIVRQEAAKYNARGTENMLVPFLTETEIEDQKNAGKVGFGRLYSDKRADPEKAVLTALQGFEDGLFRVVTGNSYNNENNEVSELDSVVNINEGDTLTFIRLTFLAGRLW